MLKNAKEIDMAREGSKHGTKVSHEPPESRHHHETFRGRPDIPHAEGGQPGFAICHGCHAIWSHKRWTLDEPRYQALAAESENVVIQCPGCRKIERQEYDGEVTLRSPLILTNEEAIIGLIRNTEKHIREHNPIARIAALTISGDTIHILTISPFLAERIGKELRKAYDGHVTFSQPEREEFIRVKWYRES
jgi:NMD protein affecting ribosome stability and mRNA decay